jgi:hypothetical protein
MLEITKTSPSLRVSTTSVADKIIEIYTAESIPTICRKTIIDKIESYHSKYRKLLKSRTSTRNKRSYDLKLETFVKDSERIFEVAACKCAAELRTCTCPRDKKIPEIEQEFIRDQRNERKMFIGGVDIKHNIILNKREERRHRNEINAKPSTSSFNESVTLPSSDDDESSSATNISPNEVLYTPPTYHYDNITGIEREAKKKKKVENKLFTSFSQACDRVGVSDRGAALLSTSILEDIGVVTKSDSSEIIDRNKVRRIRQSNRKKLRTGAHDTLTATAIYFDGRKDSTYIMDQTGEKHRRRKIVEEHISLVSEPGSEYIGHYTPVTGSSFGLTTGLLTFANENNISLDNVMAIGSDGTAVNTGNVNGTIRRIEQSLGRPLHWFICLLHGNELPLRHLIQNLDGKTTGPRGFAGPIGNQLHKCETLNIEEFTPVVVDIPFVNVKDLSTDQKYLFEIHQAISNGNVSENLANRNPGNMSHSRWLTTASRILRLYVGTEDPTDSLLTLTHFIMFVYAPMWFKIKCQPQVKFGPKHIFQTLQLVQTLNDKVKSVVQPVIQRNAFFAHPENLLLAMIQDENHSFRELGWRRIQKARNEAKTGVVRKFIIPKLNFECQNYTEIINWKNTVVTEPPLTLTLADHDISENIMSRKTFEHEDFPNHTQAVERVIKLVTDASLAVCGPESRDGWIRARLASRNRMPQFNSKKDYKLM